MKNKLHALLLIITLISLLSFAVFALKCEFAIEPVYDYARPFSATTSVVNMNGESLTLDRFGNAENYGDKIINVRSNGLVMVVGDNDLAAFYNVYGYRLTEFVYDTYPVLDVKTGVKSYRFGYYDGDGESELIPFSRGKKYGFMDSNGVEVIPPKYDYAYGFVEGMALVCAEGKLSEYGTYTDGKYGVILEDGTEILSPDSYWVGSHVSGFGYCLFYNGSADKTLVDKSGNVIKIDDNGFAPIDADYILCETNDGKKGVADRNGNMIVPLGNYEYVEKVNNQFVLDNNKIIDTSGITVYEAPEGTRVDVHYINIYKRSDFYRLTVSSGFNGMYKKYGLIDKYGTIIFITEFDSLYDIGEGLIYAEKDGKNYLYSYYGELLCEIGGNNVGECVDGLFSVYDFKSKKYGYMLNPLRHPKVFVNGEKLNVDVYPKIESDRTLVPLRGVFEALGANVSWDDSIKTVTATKGDITINLQIGSNILYKNGEPIEIDVPAKIENSRTLVPLRAVSEALECMVSWDGVDRVVNIATE